ncbi:MAG: acyl-CoA dehydrogenase family protein [Myxococcota bacterium]
MFDFSDEQKMVAKMVRRWCDEKLAPATDALERNEIQPYALMRDFAATFGLPDMARAAFSRMKERVEKGADAKKPPPDDAAETTMRDPALMSIVAMELSRVNPGFCMSFGASTGLAGGAIMAKGTMAQKERFGLPLVTLEKIGGWGMTEPGAGSDAFGSMKTIARRDGDFYLLNGQKTFITNAPYADTIVTYAKLDDGRPAEDRPVHGFILERGMKGLETPPPMRKMGMHTSPTGEVFLQDVRVPKNQLLGEDESAPAREQVRDTFHGERTGILPMCLGIVERCLEESLRYAKERVTWGKPIAEYQLVQEKLARMFVHRENVRNLLFKQIWLVKNGKKLTMAEACVCKLYSARVATEVAMEAVQIFGGNGYMTEYRVEQLARDAKLLQIGGGTDEIQIGTIAKALLRDGLPTR